MRKPQSYLNTVGYSRILLRDEYNIPDSLIPTNDAARLHALEDYPLLETRSEKILNAVVAATARLTALAERTVPPTAPCSSRLPWRRRPKVS